MFKDIIFITVISAIDSKKFCKYSKGCAYDLNNVEYSEYKKLVYKNL